MPKAGVAREMRECAGFVFPSSAETFGCVLMEAMACGCPVLTTRVGGIPAVVRDGEGIFVEVGDVEAIADGMRMLLRGDHCLPLGDIAEGVRERFSRQVVGQLLHDAYLRATGLREEDGR
jgi:rhamnosyl/mannosyltransferase